MEIKLDFTNEECKEILSKKGYIIEEMDGWYDENSYLTNCDCERTTHSTKITVAYKPCNEDLVKKDEKPLLSRLRNFSCENSISQEIKNVLVNLLLND